MEKEKESHPVRKEIIRHIHSINVALTPGWLETQPHNILLANCHPLDRKEFTSRLRDETDPIVSYDEQK